jgi:negative regulator of flagellin synthesis FlgM
MKVTDINSVIGPERVKPQETQSPVGTGPRDKVSVESKKAAEVAVQSARRTAGGDRAARLERLEASVRSGSYSPDPSRVAEQILSDAEVDARLQAMLSR